MVPWELNLVVVRIVTVVTSVAYYLSFANFTQVPSNLPAFLYPTIANFNSFTNFEDPINVVTVKSANSRERPATIEVTAIKASIVPTLFND